MVRNSITSSDGPELFLGLVGSVGTKIKDVSAALKKSLKIYNYNCDEIRVIELLHDFPKWKNLPHDKEDIRLGAHMTAGNEFRDAMEHGNALAVLSISSIRRVRKQKGISGTSNKPLSRHCYIFWSLKHPEEVLALRRIYGPAFFLVAAYSPREIRRQNLEKIIAKSHHSSKTEKFSSEAKDLMVRDEAEVDNEYGQNVRETFPMADAFINTNDEINTAIDRLVELLFADPPFHTPTSDEYGMFHARAAALRSASLSRQVGAVISASNGEIVSIGTNEVPKSGGGAYWCDDPKDKRDFKLGYETNDMMKRNSLAEVIERLKDHNWLVEGKIKMDVRDLLEELVPLMKDSQVMNVIEYSRTVHAEIAALLDAAFRGASVKGCTMYTTTFPCHDCAKHIVAAGLSKVVYIEPYPKSLAVEHHSDSIVVDKGLTNSDKVSFDPFVGVAPHRYIDLFEMVKRKEKDGSIVESTKNRSETIPRIVGFPQSYLGSEKWELAFLEEKMKRKKLKSGLPLWLTEVLEEATREVKKWSVWMRAHEEKGRRL